MPKCFFTSDTHFGHQNIIQYCQRPFKNAAEMDEALIAKWNAKIGPHDLVYHLGDFAFGKNSFPPSHYRARLRGRIHLILGNHDKKIVESDFESVMAYRELYFGKQEIVLFHYGLRTWHHDLRGSWHLFGHSHGGLSPYGKSFDIGVDANGFEPLSFDEVKQAMEKKPIGNHPQFENFEPANTTKENS